MKKAMFGVRSLIAAVSLVFAVVIATSDLGGAIDRAIDPMRFALTGRVASGKVVVVALDAASAAAIKRWPWPRDHYARMVDRLRRAGAASITFDVDFSSPSTADGDAAFAASLARSQGLVALPTFAQQARADDRRSIDSLPLPIFRDHVALASVSIASGPDGAVREAPFGTVTQGVPRPSLSAYIAGRSGAADEAFPIDYGIDPASIPRLSFVAVRDGRFDPRAVAGRSILVGATAIEMGDRYATPRWGVIPGVVIQALATETLLRGVPARGGTTATLLVALLLAVAVLRTRSVTGMAAASAGGIAVVVVLAVFCQARWQWVYPIAPALTLLVATIAGRFTLHVWRRFEDQRLTDELTDLPNRRAMLADLAGRDTVRVAVAHLSNFESLVAVLGGGAERDLLQRLADRLRLTARDERVYRLADRLLGFELDAGVDSDDALAGLRALMLQPVEVQGRRIDAAITLGIANTTAEAGLTEAAMAAEQAQRDGVFWRSAVADMATLERQVSLMGELDDALASGEIDVYYQPKLALAEDRITSCEALVRWRHRDRGFIGPDIFIPLAEQTDRIAPLTLYVIERVMTELAQWRRLGHRLTAAVNISAKLVASPAFNEQVQGLLARDIVPPSALVFEVTESATLADPEAATLALEAYRALGIAISMDDYGTGQSTLTYLRQLPLSELKIDRSFVQHAHRNRNDGVLVRSTIDLAHELGLKVVAEGVEDAACLDFLRQLGCDMVQGYLISRPLPADAFLAMLAAPLMPAMQAA